MAKKQESLSQPEMADERELESIVLNKADTVKIRNKEVRMKWMRGATTEKVTRIMLEREKKEADGYPVSEGMIGCKCAAAIYLNGYWKIRMAWWAVWRWFYYVRQYSEFELLPLIEMAQKKTPLRGYFALITSLIALKETAMMRTRKEAEAQLRILQGHSGDKGGK